MGGVNRALIAAIGVGLFGLFMLWQGFTGNVVKNADGNATIPRWIYIVGGFFMLIMPVMYAALLFVANQ